MFNYFNTNRQLQNRIRDLERLNETLIGANQVLTQELEKAQHREQVLQEKLFDVVGINKPQVKIINPTQKVPINRGTPNWGQARQSLEQQARIKYWEDKKRESEEKEQERKDSFTSDDEKINELEKEVLST